MLRYVFFDLYGTLVDIQTDERCEETARAFEAWVRGAHGPDAAAREADRPMGLVLAAMRPPPRAWGEPDITPVFSDHLQGVIGRAPTRDEVIAAATAFRACSRRRLTLVPGALETLRALAPRFGLGLVSNAQALFTLPEIAPLGLLRLLDPVVISSEVGVRKPAPRIFEAALARAGVPAGAALHVGNDPIDDVDGAHGAGLMTCLVDDGRGRAAGECRPDYSLPSVASLASALRLDHPA